MNLLAHIKETTLAHHQSAEKVLVKELKAISTIKDYGFLLQRLHTFYKPIEIQLQKNITLESIPDLKKRKHVQRIADDILKTGLSVDANLQNNFEIEKDLSYALGVLYVIEGSTQGGQFISKMIEKKLDIDDNTEITSYFKSYGDKALEMWATFKSLIAKIEDNIDASKFEKGAKDTFEALEIWLLNTKNF